MQMKTVKHRATSVNKEVGAKNPEKQPHTQGFRRDSPHWSVARHDGDNLPVLRTEKK